MTDNVVDLNVVTSLPIDPARILRKASEAGLTEVVIVGYDKDGDFWFSSSGSDGGDVLWLFELAKMKLLRIAEEP